MVLRVIPVFAFPRVQTIYNYIIIYIYIYIYIYNYNCSFCAEMDDIFVFFYELTTAEREMCF